MAMSDSEMLEANTLNPAELLEEDSKYGEEWRGAVHSAAEYNRKLLLERRLKGPYYHDPHTNTVQVLNSWTVRNFVMPSEEEVHHRRLEACLYVERKIGKARARAAPVLHTSTSSIPTPRTRTPIRASSGLATSAYSATPMRGSMTPIQMQAQAQMRMQQQHQQMVHRQMMMQQQQRAVQMLQQRAASPLVQARQLQRFAATAVKPLDSSAPAPLASGPVIATAPAVVQGGSATCGVCEAKSVPVGSTGDLEVETIMCKKCKQSFHPLQCLQIAPESLLKIKTMTTVEQKDGKEVRVLDWMCLECKICDTCNTPGDDEKLLICDLCDRGFHMYCLTTPLTRAPPGRWVCDSCVQCVSCGAKSPGPKENHKWKKGYRYCESCYKLRGKRLYCPVCNISHSGGLTGKTLVDCSRCKLQLHRVCSALSDADWAQVYNNKATNYVCPACKAEESGTPAPPRKRRRKKMAMASEIKID